MFGVISQVAEHNLAEIKTVGHQAHWNKIHRISSLLAGIRCFGLHLKFAPHQLIGAPCNFSVSGWTQKYGGYYFCGVEMVNGHRYTLQINGLLSSEALSTKM
ncbi:hypothetical protein DCAR_0206736 [Daucus carota subsp. sativus]|uniref:Uncharacterized protein n=1 Tax=Daucus carota subsp. sativus TaxID=79200 RepID=A0AAF1ALW8_DAUCS|nr:PREDICTED: uncharacterized protein LOC108208583 [Daucus carota subsp. sativus]WOG87508.1 hypothetical protein DCAR_0206736 [Daucus carota subsp. sativus]